MLATPGRLAPILRRRFAHAAGVITVGTLLLSSCQSDAPTASNGGMVPIRSFEAAPNAGAVATAATNRQLHPLLTVSRRFTSPAGLSALGGNDHGGSDPNSPFDLTYFGGAVVTRATSWNLYINCPTTPADCWGTGDFTPGTFLRDLNRSTFIQVVNQYIGSNARGRFGVNELNGTFAFPDPTLTMNDVFGVIYSAAVYTGAVGYGNIYHVFLPQGVDMCIAPGYCYSPDDPASWYFCAFHGSVDFGPDQHVLYSVEPYQAVPGCVIPGTTVHGVIDPTASTLSHELLETITDPDLDAWWNTLTGGEIADICAGFVTNARMNWHSYVLQKEYSNDIHACTDGP
jgi:hypothetical protein